MTPQEKLDPRLRVLLQRQAPEIGSLAKVAADVNLTMAEEVGGGESNLVEVLIRCDERLEENAGDFDIKIREIVRGHEWICSAAVPASALPALAEQPWVHEIEASRHMFTELDVSRLETRCDVVHNAVPGLRGGGVLLGVIDAGIDFRHTDFCNDDGTSRILFFWDQNAAPDPAAIVPVPFGRAYTNAELDGVVQNAAGATPVLHQDTEGHGTHVAGIAAGNGRGAVNGQFTGIAPETELIVVVTRGEAATLGQSNAALEAYSFIAERAAALGRPVAINQSQGMNGGGHSGESLLEVGMDMLARRPGVVIVKSAGNEQAMRIHAGGQVAQGQTKVVEFSTTAQNTFDDIIELWHDAADDIHVAVRPPGSSGAPAAADFLAPGATDTKNTQAGNEITIVSTVDASNTGDVQTVIFVSRGTAPRIQPGTWKIHLRGDTVADGRYDLWIERNAERTFNQARFTSTSNDATRTISIPGTARRIITVGSYITRNGTLGEISNFSSRGPTRYGHQKPDLVAPGQEIAAPLSSFSAATPFQPTYRLNLGTSMAAPHVAGAAALLLQINPRFTCTQVKQILMRSANKSGSAASAPDNTFGDGKLNIEEAVALARTAAFPLITNVGVAGTQLSWETDIPSTGAVRLNTHQRRMLLGRATGSLADLALATEHMIDLASLPGGTYFCEVLAFSEDDWQTIDDADGKHYRVEVQSA
jgi:subtilisin family serine protease